MRLTLLYAGLFCACAVALAALAETFAPNFLVHSSSTAGPPSPGHAAPGCPRAPSPAHPCLVGGVTHHVNVGSAALVAVLLAGSVTVGWLIAGRLLRPLRTITSSARAISASNLHQRLALNGPRDELTELGETLDDLFARLEASFESQRRFVANASHELRTPLAAERTLLQVALADPDASADTLRATCREVLALGEQQEHLIDALLTLASSEQGIRRWQPFDLADLTSTIIQDRQDQARQHDIRIAAALRPAPASGDPSLAESLIANLVDNALRHNLTGGRIEISTAATDGQAALSVSNTGTAIPPGEVDRLFHPFQKLGADRVNHNSGHGLGLAIVSSIARAHHATLTASARPEGGLSIKVSFPSAPAVPGPASPIQEATA